MSNDNKEGAGVPVAVVGKGNGGGVGITYLPALYSLPHGTKLYATPSAVMPAAPSDAVPDALADLRAAVAFLDQVRAAHDNGDDVNGTGAAKDARQWLERAARTALSQTMQPKAEHPNFETWWLMQIANAQNRRDGDDHLDLDDCDKSQYRAAFEAGARTSQAEPAAGEQARAVAYALQWPGEARLNLSTVFDTEAEASEYLARCSPGVIVVPLFALAAPGAAIAARERADIQRYRQLRDAGAGGEVVCNGELLEGIALDSALDALASREEAPAAPQAALSEQQLFDIIRGTGYVTRGQAWELAELILAALSK